MTDKRQRLLNAAIHLFHARGFWDTPTALVAREAGVANGTLFNYFPSKSSLVDAVYLSLKQDWADYMLAPEGNQAGMDLRQQMRWFWRRAIDWALNHPDRYALLMQMKISEHISDGTRNSGMDVFTPITHIMRKAQTSGKIIALPDGFLETLSLAQIDVVLRQCALMPTEMVDDLTDLGFDVFWRGIAAPIHGEISHDAN
jgi:AcrR family transcriptional regulator